MSRAGPFKVPAISSPLNPIHLSVIMLNQPVFKNLTMLETIRTKYIVKKSKKSTSLFLVMSSVSDTLYKILKDKTRRRIILLLNEKGNLSYTDLKSNVEITNNGLLNFHLKALDDLLVKDNSGQYGLTDRGRLAAKLLSESSEQEIVLQNRRKRPKRQILVVIASIFSALIVLLSLTYFGIIDSTGMLRGMFGFSTSTVCLYLFYTMIRPATINQAHGTQVRTIQDIFVSERHLQEVHEEVQRWVNDEGITIEEQRDGFVRGRLGTPSGLVTTPKYFEVTYKPERNGVIVHTEGWISIFGASEKSFSKTALVSAGSARKNGWIVMEHLWQRLKTLSR